MTYSLSFWLQMSEPIVVQLVLVPAVCVKLQWLFLDYTPLSLQIWLERERWNCLVICDVKVAIFADDAKHNWA